MKCTNALPLIIILGCSSHGLAVDLSWGDLKKGINSMPQQVTTASLYNAVKKSDISSLKRLLAERPRLSKEIKEELLSEAREIAKKARKSIGLFRSRRDFLRLVIGGALYYYFYNGNVLGSPDNLVQYKQQIEGLNHRLEEMLDPNIRWELLNQRNKNLLLQNTCQIGMWLDSLVKYLGLYMTVRSFFGVLAYKQVERTYYIVELVDKIPTKE